MIGFLCALLWVAPGQASPVAKAQKITDRAQQQLDGGDLVRAFQTAARALALDDANVDAHLIRASAGLRLAEQLPDDVAQLTIQLAHFDLKFVLDHSQSAFQRGLVRDLLRSKQPPLLVAPSFACDAASTAAFNAAEDALSRNNLVAARAAYEDAVGGCPGNALWWAYYGDSWFNAGEYSIAREKYNRALQIDPCFWSALRFRGDSYLRDGDAAAGVADILGAVACNPEYEVGWGYLEDTVAIADARLIRESVSKPSPDVAAAVLPSVWAAYWAARVENTQEGSGAPSAEAALERERGAVRAGVQAWRTLPAEQPGGALWGALARADEAGALDAAIYIWLLDAELVPGFLVYRRDHYAELVDYIRTFLVVLPAK